MSEGDSANLRAVRDPRRFVRSYGVAGGGQQSGVPMYRAAYDGIVQAGLLADIYHVRAGMTPKRQLRGARRRSRRRITTCRKHGRIVNALFARPLLSGARAAIPSAGRPRRPPPSRPAVRRRERTPRASRVAGGPAHPTRDSPDGSIGNPRLSAALRSRPWRLLLPPRGLQSLTCRSV